MLQIESGASDLVAVGMAAMYHFLLDVDPALLKLPSGRVLDVCKAVLEDGGTPATLLPHILHVLSTAATAEEQFTPRFQVRMSSASCVHGAEPRVARDTAVL